MDTREHIKEVARGMFARQGYDGVSVREIITKAKVNLGAITYHFGGKEDLYRELIEEQALRLVSAFQEIEASPERPSMKLESVIRCYLNLTLHHPELARMIIREMGNGDKRFMEIISPYVTTNVGVLRQIVTEGMEQNEFRKMNPNLAVISILGTCAMLISMQPMVLRVTEQKSYDETFIETATQHAVQFITEGVCTRKGINPNE